MDTELTTIAEVYAQSLLDLALARGEAESIDREFSEFAAYIKIDQDFRAFFTSRVIDAESRRQTLDRIFQGQMSDLLLNTLQVLNAKDRTEAVSEVQRLYHTLFTASEGIVDVYVTSAEPLTEAMKGRLQQMMASRTSKRINLIEQVDPTMLGGLRVRVGDKQIDTSIARQLRRFHQALVDHATKHIHMGTNFFEDADQI